MTPARGTVTERREGEGEEVEEEEEVAVEGEDRKESLMEWIDRQLEEAERKTGGSPWPEEAGGQGGAGGEGRGEVVGDTSKGKSKEGDSKTAERIDAKSHDSTETDSEVEATTDSEIELLESPGVGEGRLLEDSDSEEEQKDRGGEDKGRTLSSSDPTGNPENNSWQGKIAKEDENR